MPALSILVVNFQGGRFVDLLLRSLAKTLPAGVDYRVIVVDNYVVGYRVQSRLDLLRKTIIHRARQLVRPPDTSTYAYPVPAGVPVVRGTTGTGPVFWSKQSGVRGKASSQSHARGLAAGYTLVPPDSDFVLLLDQDVVFLQRDWTSTFFAHFDDPDVMLVGAFRETKIYERPFLRPFCLMFRPGFYAGGGDVFTPTPWGDTCSRLTYWCEDQGKRWVLLDNTVNTPGLETPVAGDVAVDTGGHPLLSHCGSGYASKDRAQGWLDEMNTRLESLD